MRTLNLHFRRTLTSTTVNLGRIFNHPPRHSHRHHASSSSNLTLNCASWRTLVSGSRLRFSGAHVTATTTKNIKIYMLSPAALSSSKSSSSSSSSSPGFEETENPNSYSDMGHEGIKKVNGIIPPLEKKRKKKDEYNLQPQSSKLLTLPTILTLARVASIPVFISTFYVNNWWGTSATTSIFVAAAITDWLDGYLARKMGLGTAFGAFLDPVADKLMVAATLVLLCSRPPETAILGDAPWLFPLPAIAIIGREITMSAVREWAASQNTQLLEAVAVNNLGKWKTATQMVALTMLLAARDSSIGGLGYLTTTGVALLYTSAGLAVWSLVVYIRKIWKVLLR